MANNNIVSPGIYINETDQSFIPQGIIEAGAAIVGPTSKGPVQVPTVVTSYNDYVAKFGTTITSGTVAQGQSQYSFFNSTAAYTYFNNGGSTLLVSRAVNGNYTSAQASIGQISGSGAIGTTTDEILGSISQQVAGGVAATYTLVSSSAVTGGGTNVTASITLNSATNVSSITVTGQAGTFAVGSVITFPSQSLGDSDAGGTDLKVTLVQDDIVVNEPASFVLKTIAQGSDQNSATTTANSNGLFPSGSKENIRYEIRNANTGSGTFTLVIRRGDDDDNEKIILEQYDNLTLDPFDTNFIGKAIGTQFQTIANPGTTSAQVVQDGDFPNISKYVYVSSIQETPNYLDSAGNVRVATYPNALPQNTAAGASSKGFISATGGIAENAKFGKDIDSATNIQGIQPFDYTQSFYLLNDPQFNYTSIAAPGLNYKDDSTTLNILLTNTEARADALAILDLTDYGDATVANAVTQAKSINNSYATAYFPWLYCSDPLTGRLKWAPASTFIPGVYAFNDKVGEPWFAPAGLNRGALPTVLKTSLSLPKASRDTLYADKVNPITAFPRSGVVVFGQKTLQTKASALDRINVRRLLITVKQFLDQQAGNIVFEQNTVATRNNFLAIVNPYLESVQQRQGLYAFKVVMDETINTPAVIDRNELVGQVYLQPTKTAEFIILNFNVQPTGASFPEAGASAGGY